MEKKGGRPTLPQCLSPIIDSSIEVTRRDGPPLLQSLSPVIDLSIQVTKLTAEELSMAEWYVIKGVNDL